MSHESEIPETVVIGKSSNTARVYHIAECNNYPKHPREITRGEAQRLDLRPCKSCHGNVSRSQYQGDVLADQLEDMNPSGL